MWVVTVVKLEEMKQLLHAGKLTLDLLVDLCKAITVFCDRGSTNVAMESFLSFACQLHIICMWDGPAHGLHNASKNGLWAAGKKDCYQSGKVLVNWRRGPWSSNQRYVKLKGSGNELAKLVRPKDKYARYFWPNVCWDKGHRASHLTDQKACAEWVKTIGQDKHTMHLGQMIRDCEWFGFAQRMGEYLEHWTEHRMETTYMGIMLGEIRREWEVFNVIYQNNADRIDSAIAIADAPEASDAAPAASSSSSASSSTSPAPATTRKAIRAKNANKAKHGIPHLLELYADDGLRNSITRMVIVQQPMKAEHGLLMKILKTTRPGQSGYYTKLLYSKWANGSWAQTVAKIFNILHDLDSLQRMGLTLAIRPIASPHLSEGSADMQYEDAAAEEVFELVWFQVKFRVLEGALYSYNYPMKLAGLVHQKEAVRHQFRRTIKLDIEIQTAAETQNNPDITDDCDAQWWNTGGGKVCRAIFEHGSESALNILTLFYEQVFSNGPIMLCHMVCCCQPPPPPAHLSGTLCLYIFGTLCLYIFDTF